MSTILADNFNRVGGSLGLNWVEQLGNFSTDGSKAVIDATGLSVATVSGSSQANQFVQCWCQVPDVNQNAGLVWRYQSSTLYYLVIGTTTQFNFFRRDGAGFNAIGTYGVSGLGTATWRRLAVRMVGTQIDFFLDDGYNDALEGPALRITDGGIVGAGLSGICSTGNNATGASGPLWDGFHNFDGGVQTIFVDVNATGQTLGTESDPDSSIQLGLHSAGLGRRGKLKIQTEGSTPIGDPAVGVKIGHAGKFALAGGESFPEYSDQKGAEISANNANLTIEGTDSTIRTLLQETQNRAFFQIRNDATFVLFRSLDWACTGGVGSIFVQTVTTNNLGASTEHSLAVDKCKMQLGTASVDDQTAISINADATEVRLRFNYGLVRSGRFGSSWLAIGSGRTVDVLRTWRNVFVGPVRRAILSQDGPALGETWIVDHSTYVDLNSAAHTVSALEISDGLDIAGTIRHRNSIFASRGANPTEFGTRIVANAGAVPGSVLADHNGYYGIGTPRGTGVTDNGSELDAVDPSFLDEASSFSWVQTVQSPAIVLPSDWRPGTASYQDSSSDGFDRGALELFAVTPTPNPSPADCERPPVVFGTGELYIVDNETGREVNAGNFESFGITEEADSFRYFAQGSEKVSAGATTRRWRMALVGDFFSFENLLRILAADRLGYVGGEVGHLETVKVLELFRVIFRKEVTLDDPCRPAACGTLELELWRTHFETGAGLSGATAQTNVYAFNLLAIPDLVNHPAAPFGALRLICPVGAS